MSHMQSDGNSTGHILGVLTFSQETGKDFHWYFHWAVLGAQYVSAKGWPLNCRHTDINRMQYWGHMISLLGVKLKERFFFDSLFSHVLWMSTWIQDKLFPFGVK